MRFVLAGGGTGGHFYPAYALGRRLRALGHEVLFVLRRSDPAARRLLEEDLAFAELELRGLRRKPGLAWVRFALELPRALGWARRLLADYRPDAVVCFGAYLGYPAARAAARAGIPCLLHEGNAVLGLAHRLCLKGAWALALGLPLESPPRRPVSRLTGTPVREDLLSRADPREARAFFGLSPEKTTLLVFGGSQGAEALNAAAPEALAFLFAKGLSFQVLHLSGRGKGGCAAAYARRPGLGAAVLEYTERMDLAYAAADLALCRSGASSVAELRAQALPAVLIPYPQATGGHQEANARILERARAARVLLQGDLNAETLARLLRELLESPSRLAAMRAAYGGLGLPPSGEASRSLAELALRAALRQDP